MNLELRISDLLTCLFSRVQMQFCAPDFSTTFASLTPVEKMECRLQCNILSSLILLTTRFVKRDFNCLQFEDDFNIIEGLEGLII